MPRDAGPGNRADCRGRCARCPTDTRQRQDRTHETRVTRSHVSLGDVRGRTRTGSPHDIEPVKNGITRSVQAARSLLAEQAEARTRRVAGDQDPLARGNLMRAHEDTAPAGFDRSLRRGN